MPTPDRFRDSYEPDADDVETPVLVDEPNAQTAPILQRQREQARRWQAHWAAEARKTQPATKES